MQRSSKNKALRRARLDGLPMIEHAKASLLEARSALDRFLDSDENLHKIAEAAQILITAFANSSKAFSCGNGGSMCDAMHFAEEFTGRFRNNRPGIAAIAISDPTHITCVANDFGYDQVFSRYVEAHGRKGDVLLAISTSGKSPSILIAAKAAQQIGMRVIGLTGSAGSVLEELCDVCICAPGGRYADRVQEMHIKIIHILIELVERDFYPENYIST
jgi:D-sedoheptulose 7-phosphate isomerase